MSRQRYKFRSLETDEIVELDLLLDEILKIDILGEISYKGKRYKRVNESNTRPTKHAITSLGKAYNKPLMSRSAGVHSSQASQFNEDARKEGITGVYYDPETGYPKFESRGARRREIARRGLQDLDGGYGDG